MPYNGNIKKANLTPQILSERCNKLLQQGKLIKAVQLAVQAAESTDDVLLLATAGVFLLQHAAQHEITVAIFKKSLLLLPQHTQQLLSLHGQLKIYLATALMALGDYAQAMSLFMEVVQKHPEHELAVGEMLSMALLEAGMPDQAEQVLRAWLAKSMESACIYNNMGCALERLNRSEEGISFYLKGITKYKNHPDMKFGYAMALLKGGYYEEGFKYYAQRTPRLPDQTIWYTHALPRLKKGESLKGKHLLFYQEQGLGDTIQFIRFMPHILQEAKSVTIVTLPPLERLLRHNFPNADIMLVPNVVKNPSLAAQYDAACPIPDLPYLVDLKTPQDVPPVTAYLTAPSEKIALFKRLIEAKCTERRLRVGIVWSGDARSSAQDVAADKRRSMSLAALLEGITPVKADLFNLQFGAHRSDLTKTSGHQPIYDLMDHIDDMEDTAALICNLDLVISVDTGPLHLAAALGKETWLLSRWDACWRWGDSGETTPWYPTLRIFRAQELSLAPIVHEAGALLRERATNFAG